jgi:hypothetical protein
MPGTGSDARSPNRPGRASTARRPASLTAQPEHGRRRRRRSACRAKRWDRNAVRMSRRSNTATWVLGSHAGIAAKRSGWPARDEVHVRSSGLLLHRRPPMSKGRRQRRCFRSAGADRRSASRSADHGEPIGSQPRSMNSPPRPDPGPTRPDAAAHPRQTPRAPRAIPWSPRHHDHGHLVARCDGMPNGPMRGRSAIASGGPVLQADRVLGTEVAGGTGNSSAPKQSETRLCCGSARHASGPLPLVSQLVPDTTRSTNSETYDQERWKPWS